MRFSTTYLQLLVQNLVVIQGWRSIAPTDWMWLKGRRNSRIKHASVTLPSQCFMLEDLFFVYSRDLSTRPVGLITWNFEEGASSSRAGVTVHATPCAELGVNSKPRFHFPAVSEGNSNTCISLGRGRWRGVNKDNLPEDNKSQDMHNDKRHHIKRVSGVPSSTWSDVR